ncbi:MAG: hypothetical protein II956_04445 [Bacteroidales bacterium]|nr:hypothetical protein [Bacteroidales bacterium]
MAKTGKDIEPFIYFHPGEILSEKMDEMEVSVDEFSKISGLEISEIKRIKACKADINPVNAASLEKATQIPAAFWLKAQENYNMFLIKKLVETLTRNLKSVSAYDVKKQKIRQTIQKLSKVSETI